MARPHKNLHCKRAFFPGRSSGTLQHLLESALKRHSPAKVRAQNLTSDRFRVVAQHYRYKGALAGVMLSYEQGSKAASLINDPNADQLSIDHFAAPPDSTGQKREWVEGLLHFLVRDNHIVFIQSMAVRVDQMEEHFTWLLSQGHNNAVIVALEDRPPKDIEARIKSDHVKSVVINGPLMSARDDDTIDGKAKKTVSVEGPLLDALKAALDANNHGFKWTDGLDGNLEATLELTYRRETTEPAQRLLDKLAIAFRGAEGVDASLVLNSGDTIRHDQLRLTTKRGVEATDGVLSPQDAFSVMHDWMEELAKNGQL